MSHADPNSDGQERGGSLRSASGDGASSLSSSQDANLAAAGETIGDQPRLRPPPRRLASAPLLVVLALGVVVALAAQRELVDDELLPSPNRASPSGFGTALVRVEDHETHRAVRALVAPSAVQRASERAARLATLCAAAYICQHAVEGTYPGR